MNTTTTYWVNLEAREWGMLQDTGSTGLSVVENDGTDMESPTNDAQQWVEDLVRLFEQEEEYCIVEQREEFEYIHRCLEKLAMPLAYSPLEPVWSETEGGRFSEMRVA